MPEGTFCFAEFVQKISLILISINCLQTNSRNHTTKHINYIVGGHIGIKCPALGDNIWKAKV